MANCSKNQTSRSFYLTLFNGIFASVGFRLVDSSTVLSAFIMELTKSNIMVGLVSSTMNAGFMWPQMIMSNLLEHRPRKMPFYTFGILIRIVTWALIPVSILIIGDKNHLLLFTFFYILYFAACSSLGISSIPFNDIVAKAIPTQKRARLFGLRQLIGEILGIGVGFLIRYILGDSFRLSFPNNYALIFVISVIMITTASVSFALVKEPIHPVRDGRRPFWQHLGQGPRFLRNDPNYRNFFIFRVISSFGSMCIPFYVPFALDRLNLPASSIGLFTAAGAASATIFNVIWGYIGERRGSQSVMTISSSIACFTPLIAISTLFFPQSLQSKYYLLVFMVNQAFSSGMSIANITYTLDMAPSMSRPTYLGFINTLMFPMSFVPVFAGALLRIISYELMFTICAGVSILAVYFAFRLTDNVNQDDTD